MRQPPVGLRGSDAGIMLGGSQALKNEVCRTGTQRLRPSRTRSRPVLAPLVAALARDTSPNTTANRLTSLHTYSARRRQYRPSPCLSRPVQESTRTTTSRCRFRAVRACPSASTRYSHRAGARTCDSAQRTLETNCCWCRLELAHEPSSDLPCRRWSPPFPSTTVWHLA